MKDPKISVFVPVTFSKCTNSRVHQVQLTLLNDRSVYLEGDEELIFDQGDALKAALTYLESKGYDMSAQTNK